MRVSKPGPRPVPRSSAGSGACSSGYDHGQAQVQELHLDVGGRVAVGALVRGVEAAAQRRPVREAPHLDRDGVLLAQVAQVRGPVVGRRADRRQDGLDLPLHLPVARLRPGPVGPLERLQHGAHEVVPEIGGEHAPGREGGGRRRDDDPRNAELARDRHRVERPAAAVGHQRVVPGIEAALGGDAAHRQRHLHVGQPHDAGGRVVAREPERQPEALLDGPRRRRVVERHGAAEEAARRDAPQHQVRVGDGGLDARRARSRPDPAPRPRSAAPGRARRPRRSRRWCRRPRSPR